MPTAPATRPAPPSPPAAAFVFWLVLGLVLIDLFVIGMVVLSVNQSRAQYEASAASTAQNLALALSESVAGDIEKIDVALQTAADEIERQYSAGGIDPKALDAFISRLKSRLPEAVSMRVLDSHGIARYGPGVDPRHLMDNSDREYFTRQRDNPKLGLAIAKPVFARIDKMWVIPLSRPFRLPDGSFGGVVYSNVALERLTTMFSRIDVGARGSVSLRDAEMRVFARYPIPADAAKVLGETLVVPPLRELIRSGREGGSYTTSQTVDGVERKFAVHAVPGLRLYIVLGRATEEYIAPWLSQARNMFGMLALILAITTIAAWAVIQAWKRRLAAMADLMAERASLRQAYAYNRSLIEASLDPLVTIGTDGKITDVNTATEAVTGYARDVLVGTDFSVYFSAPDRAAAGYRRVFADGMVRDYELEIRHRDGHLTPVLYNATVYRDEAGGIVGVFAAARDIGERKRIEEELRKSEARFREALEHAPIGMAIATPEGRFTQVNHALCQVLGYAPEELLSLDFAQITFVEDLDNDLAQLKRLESGELGYYEIEKRFVRKDGSIVWAQLTASLIRDVQGKPLQVIKQIQDVTERKRVDEEIRRLNQELEGRVRLRTRMLEEANRELEELSYSMSHDMRTPLRAIDGFSKLLLDEYGTALNSEGSRMLTLVRGNAQRMASQIDDVLRFLNLRKRKLEWQAVDIAELAHEVFLELQVVNPARRLRLVVSNLPPAWGDGKMLRQVLANLLSNAIKFSPSEREARIEIDGAAGAEANTYSVTDHGIGFDMKYVGKLFKIFERVHETGLYQGTGIGLAMVKRIVERHGGRVWAEGRVGQGATFHFSLPNRESGAASPHEDVAPEGEAQR